MKTLTVLLVLCLLLSHSGAAQDLLPPPLPWKGKSEQLIASSENRWITPAEKSQFTTTPSYEETIAWLEGLSSSSSAVEMVSAGITAQNRDIKLIIASAEGTSDPAKLRNSPKPLLLVQAGIHAGEIDGKDAGLMLLRDIAHGKKKELLNQVNLLFIPVLNPDGHERKGFNNRVNQRGPDNMGWRTNSKNLNLNRDYTKADTEEINTVLRIIQKYDPDLYLDLHVTDGADYQYDITYGFASAGSPSSAGWLKSKLTPFVDQYLEQHGHVPGPIIFAANGKDFSDGMAAYTYSPRFSHAYGDIRHLPTILVENHSLKPYRQRVLGTYIFLEAVIRILAKEGNSLAAAIAEDKLQRKNTVVLTWKKNDQPETIMFKGVESKRSPSPVVPGTEYVAWTGKAITKEIPLIRYTTPDLATDRPNAYVIPVQYQDVISRIKAHGIEMEILGTETSSLVTQYRFSQYRFSPQPVEGHFTVSGEMTSEERKVTFPAGSVRIKTDQPLGDLAVHLLDPSSPDSFLQWGFFPGIFSRTEYIEEYVMMPLAEKMLRESESLQKEFEQKRKDDPDFATSKDKIYQWFYTRSPYADHTYLVYPIRIE